MEPITPGLPPQPAPKPPIGALLLMLLVGIAIGSGGYWFLNRSKPTVSTTVSTSTPSPSNSASTVTTNNSVVSNSISSSTTNKTYVNPANGFSLQYPANYYAIENTDNSFSNEGLIARISNFRAKDFNIDTADTILKVEGLDRLVWFWVGSADGVYKDERSSKQNLLVKSEAKTINGIAATIEYYRHSQSTSGSTQVSNIAAFWTNKNGKSLFISSLGNEGILREEDIATFLAIVGSLINS